MAKLQLLGFSGEIPRMVSRLLPQNSAEMAFNTRLDDGGLTPIRLSRFTHIFPTPPVDAFKTLYRHGAEWLAWENLVYPVPGPVAQDRLYIFGDGAPKMRLSGTTYDLAVSAPPTALTATVSGTPTSEDNVTRLYVYTNVTQFGEESEPSPVSDEVDWKPGQTVTLSGFDTTMQGNRTAAQQRIYRSQTGSTSTQLFLIAERAATTADFVDNISPEAIQEPLASAAYNPPPDGLTGVVSMPNGMMAGFMGKDVYFCEPYLPHAWPELYVMSVDYPIVGLGAYGTTLVVMTEGNPYIMSGSAPENMQSEKLELNLPCINARGIQDLGYAVAYPTHAGIVLVQNGSAAIGSEQLFSRDDWQALFPSTMVSGQFNGRYLSCYSYSDEAGNEYSGTIIMDVTGAQPFIIRSDITPDAFFYDVVSGDLFFVLGAEVYTWDARGQVNALQYWRSKEFVLPRPTNFGAILIEAGDAITEAELDALEARRQAVIDANQALIDAGDIGGELNGAPINDVTLNGDYLAPVPGLNRTVSVGVYADDQLVATVSKINNMARLPSGFLARRWKVAVSSDMPVTQITLAGTGTELMEV